MNGLLRYLGHAGFVAEFGQVSVLIDPWFHSAFLHSWFPYPDNRYLLAEILQQRFDYLYVSHAHEDHYDERFLRELDRSITVIVPKFRSEAMAYHFRKLGFSDLVVLEHKESYQLAPGFTAQMYLDTSHKEDSGLLLDFNGWRFLDLNDCNPPMSELPDDISLLAAQFSGAMWYPNCYDYPNHTMEKKVTAVRQNLLNTLFTKLRLTKASAYIPCAGPACFLDPVLEAYNDRDHTIFPHWEDVAAEFVTCFPEVTILRVFPGDRIQGDMSRVAVDRFDNARTAESIPEYRIRRYEEWNEHYVIPDAKITSSQVMIYFQGLVRRNKHLVQDLQKVVGLQSGTASWRIEFGGGEPSVTEDDGSCDAAYTFIVPPVVLRAIIEGSTGWDDALLSMRVKLQRSPDVFDLKLMSLLRYGNDPVLTRQLMRDQMASEFIERDGLRLQRFCPHAGEDLALAIVCDGIIECPRHHWRWDSRTGECLAGGNLKLKVEMLPLAADKIAGGAAADVREKKAVCQLTDRI